MEKQSKFSKNRRIAFVCFSSALGGLELSTLRLASEFNKREAECLIIVPPNTPLAGIAPQYRLKTGLLKLKWKYFDFTASKQLVKIFKTNKLDAVIAMQSKDISTIVIANIFCPSVKLMFYQEMQSGIKKNDFFHNWIYSKLSLWFTLTRKMRQQVIENTLMPAERILVIPIGTDMQRFNPQSYSQKESRLRFEMPREKFIIGMLGRLDPQKGLDEFIRTIPVVLEHKPDVHFVIGGDESRGQKGYKQYLQDLCNSLGINHCVQFIPFTDEVPEFLSALDIFVLPSHSETFGFVLVEAMAMGKAIVATNSGGVPEIITNGSTGLLVPPRDITALSEVLLRIIKDEKLRTSLSSEARKEASERFNIDHTIDQLVAAINDL